MREPNRTNENATAPAVSAPDSLEQERDLARAEIKRLEGELEHLGQCFNGEHSELLKALKERDQARAELAELTARFNSPEVHEDLKLF
jgi:hypothetical protein